MKKVEAPKNNQGAMADLKLDLYVDGVGEDERYFIEIPESFFNILKDHVGQVGRLVFLKVQPKKETAPITEPAPQQTN